MPTVEELINDPPKPEVDEIPKAKTEVVHPEWWKARSGTKPLSEYQEHPMNPFHADWWAQVLRGGEGILGALDYALVDIGVGLMRGAYSALKGLMGPKPPAPPVS